jgi:ABC-type glycerol-3-phosphate transport system substrate-binding protein
MRAKKMSRRDFVRTLSLAAAGGLMAACAPKQTAAPKEVAATPVAPAKEGGELAFWVCWGGNYTEAVWDKLRETDEFAEMLPGYTVDVKAGSTGEPLLTAVAAGTPPDGASCLEYIDYFARGVLLPVEDWIANSSIIKKENYFEGYWNDGSYKGTMYGVPANEAFLRFGLMYNTRLLEEAGLDPDNPPVTWDELFEWHKKLTKFDDAGNLIQLGIDPYAETGGGLNHDGWFPPMSWGWTWFDADSGEFDLDNPKMAESMEVMGEFIKFAGPDKLEAFRSVEGQANAPAMLRAQVLAMTITGYWRAGHTANNAPEAAKYLRSSWVPVPENRRGVKLQGTGGHYVVMFKDGKDPEGIFKISEFLNTDIAFDIIWNTTGWLPGHMPYLETVDPAKYNGLPFYFRSMDEATEWHSALRCEISAFADSTYAELRESVYRDEMTGAEAAAEFQKRCDDEYKAQGFK